MTDEYVVQCDEKGKPKWLATKGPGSTNYVTAKLADAFRFEEEGVAELYASIWSGETSEPFRVVKLEPAKRRHGR